MIELTTKGSRWAIWTLVALAVMVALYLFGRHDGKVQAQDDANAAAVVRVDAALRAAKVSADSLERVSASLVKLAALSRVTVKKTEARTDSAHVFQDRAALYALHVLRDSLATIAQAKLAIDSLLRADSALNARFQAERSANQKALADHLLAIEGKDSVIAGKDRQLEKATDAIGVRDTRIKDLVNARPGLVHRGVKGVLSAVAGGGCSALLWSVAGPVGALGAGVACAAVAGALTP